MLALQGEVPQVGGGGKDHVGRRRQIALPVERQMRPVPTTVVNQALIGQVVQQMDLGGGGGPQHGVPEAVATHGPEHLAGLPLPGPAKQQGGPLRHHGGGGQRVKEYARADLPALLAFLGAGGLKEEDLGALQPCDELLGAGGDGLPGLVGEDNVLFQGEDLRGYQGFGGARPSSLAAVSLLRRSTWRRRSTPPERNWTSPMRRTAASIWPVRRS